MHEAYTLTKEDIRFLAKADAIVVHMGAPFRNGEGHTDWHSEVRFIQRDRGNCLSETIRELPIPVGSEYRKGTGRFFGHVSLYHFRYDKEGASAVVALLKAGDRIAFRFYPDAGTNQYLQRIDIHSDRLYLDITRKHGKSERRLRFVVEESTCPDNSARMCQGEPFPYPLRDLETV